VVGHGTGGVVCCGLEDSGRAVLLEHHYTTREEHCGVWRCVDRPSVFLRYGSLEIPRLPLYMYDVEHVVPFRTIWDMVGGGPLGVRPTNRFDGLPLGFPQQAGL
jgi:hypothetical protein